MTAAVLHGLVVLAIALGAFTIVGALIDAFDQPHTHEHEARP